MIIKNFLFHRVSDEIDHLWPPMPVSLFNTLIGYITRKYSVIQLEQHVLSGHPITKGKPLATVLFDDGYKDNIEYAVPVLQKHRCPASFYVVTDCIDRNIPTWTYIVDHLLQNTGKKTIKLDQEFVPDSLRQNSFNNYGEKLSVGSRLKPWMKSLSNDKRQIIMKDLQVAFDDVTPPIDKMMSWEDLRSMKSAGYIIGSHSVSHPLLATIQDEKELYNELNGSGIRIQEKLGQFPSTISYPVGSFDDRVINLSQQAGYKIGLAVKQEFYNTEKDNQFAVPRVELYNEPLWKCKLRMAGVYTWVKRRMKP